jgi:hypothetical protein
VTNDIRRVRTYGNGPSIEVTDVLQTVLVAELLAPSDAVWLVSPWISDIPVLDNRDGAMSNMGYDWAHRPILLSEVLPALLDAETRVTVVLRGDTENLTFRSRLKALSDAYPTLLRIIESEDVHEKGLVTDHALVTGSMNFTFGGRAHNVEALTLDTNGQRINQVQLELSQTYPWERQP